MNLRDIDEIFEIRSSLEELAIRKAIPYLPKAKLQQILNELSTGSDTPAQNGEEGRILKMNEGLHGTILAYAIMKTCSGRSHR